MSQILEVLIPVADPVMWPAGGRRPKHNDNFIIAGRIAGVDQIRVLAANTPFFLGIIVFLLIAIAVPGLALWLPELLRN